MLLKHHEKTQELEYKQQKSVHTLREEQITKQHSTELLNQKEYMDRSEKELLRKHALELKQQPKSLKVRVDLFCLPVDDSSCKICNFFHGSKKNCKSESNFVRPVKPKLDSTRH